MFLCFFSFITTFTLSIGYNCRSVKMKMIKMKFSCFCQCLEASIVQLDQMFCNIIMQRVKNSLNAFGLPIIAFVLITGVAAINKVIEFITAIVRPWLKVVKGQFSTDINLVYSTIATLVAVFCS